MFFFLVFPRLGLSTLGFFHVKRYTPKGFFSTLEKPICYGKSFFNDFSIGRLLKASPETEQKDCLEVKFCFF